jgi:hypothetical protein
MVTIVNFASLKLALNLAIFLCIFLKFCNSKIIFPILYGKYRLNIELKDIQKYAALILSPTVCRIEDDSRHSFSPIYVEHIESDMLI